MRKGSEGVAMSRLVMWNVVTLDGFFDGATSWDLHWHDTAWCDELERFSIDQLRGADRVLYGRVTYEGMAAYWSTATGEVAELMSAVPKVVFSRTLQHAEWANTTVTDRDPAGAVADLKLEGAGSTLVFGSGQLCEALTRAGLFDEYRLVLAPVVLGTGRTLFDRGLGEFGLKLVEARTVSSGAVILRYEPGPVLAGGA
jgi:dihydrofolate reductase